VAYTSNQSADAFYGETTGPGSYGALVITRSDNSRGVYSETHGQASEGFVGITYGANSNGVSAYSTFGNGLYAEAGPSGGNGVRAVSAQSYGLYADTARSDQKYGIYTPDYLFAKGTQVPAADVAEYMPVTEDVTPGTVLVIGEDGKLQTSATAYDTRVAGIVSTEPGVSLGTKEGGNPGEEIIAVAGRVPCKVDATSAPIHAGDLLTTSDNPGYAMKSQQVNIGGVEIYRPGTTLGKAMGSLDSGTGTIEVLVTLQ
jgi:hypothetical protein